jgi:hypothetical protein
MRVALAFRAFFAALFQKDTAERIERALQSGPLAQAAPAQSPTPRIETKPAPSERMPARSDALTLLMVLQRDSRLLDLVCESLDGYSDEQIGGAARNVLVDTGRTLNRMFGLQPLSSQAEGERIELPNDASPMRYRVTGQASARSGCVAHPGWIATKVDLPQWTGHRDDVMVLAPVEVESES